MAPHITITADHDGSLDNEALRDALADLDVSESSPVNAGGNEVGTSHTTDTVTVTAGGANADGDFTKTSQDALVDALKNLDAVDAESVSVDAGGYTPDDE